MRKSRRIRGAVVCAVAALVTFAPTRGAESSEAEPRPEQVDEVEYVEVNVSHIPASNTIATKLPVELHLTPANVGVVTAALLEEQDAQLLGDALRNVSSLNVQQNGGVHDFFLIRGFDSLSGGLVLTDGAVEPEASWYPLYNVAGVEVLKGPAGFLYGSDPLSGVVNIVRKQPVPADFAVFHGSLGSFSSSEATLDWNLADESGSRSFRLNGFGSDADNYRDDKQSRHYALNPGFRWQIDSDSSLNFNLEYVDAEYSPDAGLPLLGGEIPDVPRRRSYQTPFDFSEQALYRFQVDYETRIGERVTLRNKFYYRDLDWRSTGTQFIGVFPDGGGGFQVGRVVTTLDDRQKVTGNQLEAIVELGAGSVRHHLLFGVELKDFSDTFDIGLAPPFDPMNPMVPGIPSIDLFNPVESATSVTAFPFLVGESESFVVAPYVVDQIEFSSRWQLLLGARWDDISRDDERFLAQGPVQESLSRDDSKVSPMAGVVFVPRADLSLYANYGESFAPAGVRVFGELEPEESRGFEVGVKQRFLAGKVRTTTALYQIDRDNVAIPDDLGVTQQAGDQRSRGFEFELAAEPRPQWRAFAVYAYTDAELTRFAERAIVGFDPMTGQPIEATIDRSGNRPAFVPEHLLSLWVSRSFKRGLGVAGGARWFSDQYIAEDNGTEIDGAVLFDAAVFCNYKQYRFSLNFKNITDVEYERRGFGSGSVIPAEPFAVYAGVGFRI